eukprot:8399782-Pyramimonas_sp.AAC.1
MNDQPDPTASSSSGPPGPASGGPPVLPIASEPLTDASLGASQPTEREEESQHFSTKGVPPDKDLMEALLSKCGAQPIYDFFNEWRTEEE